MQDFGLPAPRPPWQKRSRVPNGVAKTSSSRTGTI